MPAMLYYSHFGIASAALGPASATKMAFETYSVLGAIDPVRLDSQHILKSRYFKM
jgi:hypothetical protein